MSLDDQPKNEIARQAGVGSLPSRWGSGRQTGGSEGLSRLDFGEEGISVARLCLSGEKPCSWELGRILGTAGV